MPTFNILRWYKVAATLSIRIVAKREHSSMLSQHTGVRATNGHLAHRNTQKPRDHTRRLLCDIFVEASKHEELSILGDHGRGMGATGRLDNVVVLQFVDTL